ncbi:hypothetical protein PFISCL1PPCAC_7977, partial [Pristionchus fissidentatus]
MIEHMEELFHFLLMNVRVLIAIGVAMIKACVPMGILPRKSVKGDVCLITGAGSGIGRLMAVEFAKRGCILVLWDVNEKGNEVTKALLGDTGATVHTYTVDLSKREQINEKAAKVLKDVGRVDILVNNAGVVTGKSLIESPDDWIERTMAVNASACLFTAKNFVKGMIERNHGHIVTIASLAGKNGVSGMVDYCSSKFAAVGYHESLAAELRAIKKDGINTTLVCPYMIKTGMFDGWNNKSPSLVSELEPEYVVDCIMEAVLTNKEELQMPKIAYFMAITEFLPTEAKRLLLQYLGQYDAMDTFKGR